METRLANRLLRELLEWDEQQEGSYANILQTLAEWKWDTYEGFRAGSRFMESLARWLAQFPDSAARMRWIEFVAERLVFVSRAELDHAIASVYYDVVRRDVIDRVAARMDAPRFANRTIVESSDFRAEQRRILVLALSDGARLDILRRSSSGLSHEQFFPSVEIADDKADDLSDKLSQALSHFGSDALAQFNHVLLVDDFYGSGTSLIDTDDTGQMKGKARKFQNTAAKLVERGALAADYNVTLVLYIASAAARTHIESQIDSLGLRERWSLRVVQTLPSTARVERAELLDDCDWFWDPVLQDGHKKSAARGYKDSALPLVLFHNTPNNSVSPLWADSAGRTLAGAKSLNRRALFPRYERHHSDRP